jgi:hypothetical protein
VFASLLFLVLFSYAYHVALAIAIFTSIILGILYSQQQDKSARVLYQFELTSQGMCTFDGESYYQLQLNSRLSFLGCWLNFISTIEGSMPSDKRVKKIFIYRDSLSEQDFSRISRILKSLTSNSVEINQV